MNALKHIYGLIVLTLFWATLFFTLRVMFISKYHDLIEDYTSTINYGMIGDLSTIGGILGLSALTLLITTVKNRRRHLKILSSAILIIVILIDYSSALLYSEWGSTLSWRAMSYLQDSKVGWYSALTFIDIQIIYYIMIGIIFTAILFRTIDFFFIGQLKRFH